MPKYKYHEYITLGFMDGQRVRRHIYGNTKAELDNNKYLAKKEFDSARNPTNMTLGGYIRKWKDAYLTNREANTVLYYETALLKFKSIEHKTLRQITKTDLQEIINQNRDMPRTCKKLKQVISKIMETAIDDGYIDYNPARRLDLPMYKKSEKRALTDAEKRAVREVSLPPMEHLAVTLFYVFGLRPEELRALTPGSIDLKRKELYIFSAVAFDDNKPYIKDTKNHEHRILPIPDAIIPEVKKYLDDLKCLYLFHNSEMQLMTKSNFRRFAARILKAINRQLGGTDTIKATDMTLYTFRHNVGTELYYAPGMSNKKKAQFMGHSEDMFIKTYSHLDETKEDIQHYFKAIGM